MTRGQQQLFALSGVFHAIYCIHRVSQDSQPLAAELDAPLLQAVLTIDAERIEDIFYVPQPSLETSKQELESHSPQVEFKRIDQDYSSTTSYLDFPLKEGRQLCKAFLAGSKAFPTPALQLLMDILRVERALNKGRHIQKELGQGIQQIQKQKELFQFDTAQVYERLADLYTSYIRTLGRPIMVKGSPLLLQQTYIQNKVRGLLLAAIRCAVLWRQLGGKRRQFVFQRKKLLQEILYLESN